MRPNKLSLALNLLLAGAVCLGAQADSLAVDPLPVEGSPAQRNIHAVLLARNGFLWIGSQQGLARYDGYRVVPFRLEGIKSDQGSELPVRSLFEDADGWLWLATAAGLVRYEPGEGKTEVFRPDAGRPDSLSHDDLTCLHAVPAYPGRLWIGSAGGSLDEIDLASRRITRRLAARPASPLSPMGRIYAMASDPTGALWIGSANGLFRYLPTDHSLRRHALPMTGSPVPRPIAIKAILRHAGDDGTLWLGSAGAGLLRFRPGTGTWQHCRKTGDDDDPPGEDVDINAIVPFPGAEEDLLIGTDAGLYRFDPGSGGCHRLPLFVDDKVMQVGRGIQTIWRDPRGIVWIGSRSDGLCKWSPLKKKFSHYRPFQGFKPNPLANWVTSMEEFGDRELLVTTYGGGVLAFDRSSRAFRRLALDPGRPGRKLNFFISDSDTGSDGSLWLATGEGMARCSAAGRLQKLYAISADRDAAETIVIFAFARDSRGLIWIGTDRGLVRLDPGDGSLRRYRHDRLDPRSLSNDRVNTVLEGAFGAIWAGTDDGLNLLDPGTGRFAVYKNDGNDPASLVGNQVNNLTRDSQGRTWVCTASGLDMLERRGEKVVFRHYRVPGGDPGQNLFRVLVEERRNRFWAGTSAGLARFDSENGTFTFYDRRDGVVADGLSEAFLAFRSRDNEIFFGGRDGIIAFRPDEIVLNHHAPEVAATGFRVYDSRTEVDAGGLLSMKPQGGGMRGEKVLCLEFAALDFVRPEKNQYAYRLEGRDPDWIYQGQQRMVVLEKLPLGRHTLHIKAANNEGVWNENGETVPIQVRLPYWEQWRVPILGAVLLALLAAIILWRRRRSRLLRRAAIPDNLDRVVEKFSLSKREAEILCLLLAGRSNKEIEDALFIAMATVKIHVHNIFRKVQVGSRLQLLLRVQQEAKKTQ
ncbi:MAG: LuxR C-terminal-related transcriptional regulator [Acidobacteria bacterium]|jgi:ligand-binding sensor domain-containing protein/DNA-binding CsgD family transcriptional regulator|nr:LuxR C-terminal-related transcriptional regulator [Acidobacteriota bacterium]